MWGASGQMAVGLLSKRSSPSDRTCHHDREESHEASCYDAGMGSEAALLVGSRGITDLIDNNEHHSQSYLNIFPGRRLGGCCIHVRENVANFPVTIRALWTPA